jgi:hypothetical protein
VFPFGRILSTVFDHSVIDMIACVAAVQYATTSARVHGVAPDVHSPSNDDNAPDSSVASS